MLKKKNAYLKSHDKLELNTDTLKMYKMMSSYVNKLYIKKINVCTWASKIQVSKHFWCQVSTRRLWSCPVQHFPTSEELWKLDTQTSDSIGYPFLRETGKMNGPSP